MKKIFGLLAILILIAVVVFVSKESAKNYFCANQVSCIKNLSGKYDPSDSKGEFLGQKVSAPKEIASIFANYNILGATTQEKRIEINLTNQHLYAYEGNNLIYEFPISSGKWGQTPTGTFQTWIKLKYTRMTGGDPTLGTYYDLPNVPFTMYFYNDETPKYRGYGIHGAYWHNNFGFPMSHGCINMKPADAEVLFYWANPPSNTHTTKATAENPGTKIIIYGKFADS